MSLKKLVRQLEKDYADVGISLGRYANVLDSIGEYLEERFKHLHHTASFRFLPQTKDKAVDDIIRPYNIKETEKEIYKEYFDQYAGIKDRMHKEPFAVSELILNLSKGGAAGAVLTGIGLAAYSNYSFLPLTAFEFVGGVIVGAVVGGIIATKRYLNSHERKAKKDIHKTTKKYIIKLLENDYKK